MLVTSGTTIREENTGERVIPWGAWIWGSDFMYRYDSRITDALDFLKAHGFTATGTEVGWSNIESVANSGVYDQNTLDKFLDLAQKCRDRGLYCGFSLRVSATNWTNVAPDWYEPWSYADRFYPPYEADWRTYWEGFKNLWVEIASRLESLDNVFYIPWFYPWHGQDPVTGQWPQPEGKHAHWENVMTPELFAPSGALRDVTQKMLVWTPVGQGSAWDRTLANLISDSRNVYITDSLGRNVKLLKNDPGGNTARYDPDLMEPYPGANNLNWTLDPSAMGLLGNNICFGTNGHKPHNLEKGKCDTPADWRGTDIEREFQYHQFEPGRRFMLKYNVPMLVHEMGYFYYTSCNDKNIWDWVQAGYRHRIEQIVAYPPMACVYWQFDDGNESIIVDRYVNQLNETGLLLKELNPNDGVPPTYHSLTVGSNIDGIPFNVRKV